VIKTKFIIASLGMAAALLSLNANAAVVDLGTNGSGTINGALFEVGSIHPAGTGVFQPFLSIQANGWEQGYNSSSGNFDTKREPQWNHEIRFSDLQVTNINNTAYFGFAVDVNEPNGGNKTFISLDALKIWTSATTQNSTSTNGSGFFSGSLGTLRYDLGANSVIYNDKHSGSGTSDINIYVPVSLFAGASPNDFIYMYQRWGNTTTTEGGFEETRLIAGITPVPEMNALFPIVGLVTAVGATHVLRRRKMARLSS
jgi:hypothetical protein